MTITAEVTFNDNGAWYCTDVSVEQYMRLLQTGTLPDGKSVCAIKLFDFPQEEDRALIYDFILAKKGVTPWRQFPAVNV